MHPEWIINQWTRSHENGVFQPRSCKLVVDLNPQLRTYVNFLLTRCGAGVWNWESSKLGNWLRYMWPLMQRSGTSTSCLEYRGLPPPCLYLSRGFAMFFIFNCYPGSRNWKAICFGLMINISKQKKVFLTQVCVGLCDKGRVGSGASVVWTINCWAPAQLALFTINYPGGQKAGHFCFKALPLIMSFLLLGFNLMNNDLAKR